MKYCIFSFKHDRFYTLRTILENNGEVTRNFRFRNVCKITENYKRRRCKVTDNSKKDSAILLAHIK